MKQILMLWAVLLAAAAFMAGCGGSETNGQQDAAAEAAAETAVAPSVAPSVETAAQVTAEKTPPPEVPDTDTRDLSEKVAEAIQNYCPDGTAIINTLVEKAQGNPYNTGAGFLGGVKRWTDMFLQAGTYDTVFGAAGVIVHEETHAYQVLDWASHYVDGEQLVIRDDVLDFFSTDGTKSIPRSEIIDPFVPEALRTARYSQYVAPGVEVGGNANGLLGLLREFEAYHMEARTSFDLLKMLEGRPVRPKEYFDCFVGLSNRVDAYYEFRFYILRYMMTLKETGSEWYDRLLEREGLWKAFKYHDEAYGELVQRIPESYPALCGALTAAGYDAELTGDALNPGLRIGNVTKGSNNDVRVLHDEMKKPEYQEMLSQLRALGE